MYIYGGWTSLLRVEPFSQFQIRIESLNLITSIDEYVDINCFFPIITYYNFKRDNYLTSHSDPKFEHGMKYPKAYSCLTFQDYLDNIFQLYSFLLFLLLLFVMCLSSDWKD